MSASAMRLDIIAAAQLSDADAQALTALDAAVYPGRSPAQEAADLQNWASPQWHILIHNEKGQLVSHVGVVTRLCLGDGKEVLIGGIGGVMTRPPQRGKGFAGTGLRRAIAFMESELRVELSLLFCAPRMVRYYERFGFRNFTGDTFARRAGKRILFPRSEVMVRPALKPAPPFEALDVCGLPW